MTQSRLKTVVPILILLLLATTSCDRLTGSSNVTRPVKTVDFPSMVGKSLLELTKMLGQARQQALCYHWDLPEGDLSVCYERKYMSSLTYELKPDAASGSERGVGSPEEMMALVGVDTQGKAAEENRRGFFTYNALRINDKRCFVDVHKRGPNLIFGPREPRFMKAHLYIHNPHLYVYSGPDRTGNSKEFYEQQADVDLKVGSVLLGGLANWEVCTEPNFAGKCKMLDMKSEYMEHSKNFIGFGIGDTIRSLRPVEE